MKDRTSTVTALALIFMFLLAAAAFGQDTQVCGYFTIDPEGQCLLFHPFSGGTYQLTNDGGFSWPDTVLVTGHPGDISDPECLTLSCGMFQYPCFVVSAIVENPACAPVSCCRGTRGNLDNDPEDLVDISDLTYLTSCLFDLMFDCQIVCLDEWDMDGGGGIDITDLQMVVDYLFFGGTLPPC
jgi:hypothetical protein